MLSKNTVYLSRLGILQRTKNSVFFQSFFLVDPSLIFDIIDIHTKYLVIWPTVLYIWYIVLNFLLAIHTLSVKHLICLLSNNPTVPTCFSFFTWYNTIKSNLFTKKGRNGVLLWDYHIYIWTHEHMNPDRAVHNYLKWSSHSPDIYWNLLCGKLYSGWSWKIS